MKTDSAPQSATAAVALLRLNDDWFPDPVVLNAITHWVNEAMLSHSERWKAELALRWCKWQHLISRDDPSLAGQYCDLFSQFYRVFEPDEVTSTSTPPHIDEISTSDLLALGDDLAAMKEFRTRFVSLLRKSQEYATSCERHLWGPITDGIGGAQSHFWALLDYLP